VNGINVAVEMAFDGSTWKTPKDGITWTDVTAYVLHSDGVTISRGKSSQRDEVRAGECSFTMKDTTRRFDPENTAGPYYGFLNPGVPVRIRAFATAGTTWFGEGLTWDGVDLEWESDSYPRFYGFVEEWPQVGVTADRVAFVPIQAVDAFGMLALARQSDSVFSGAILDLDPVGYWPLTEPAGSTTVVDRGAGGNHGSVVDEPEFGLTALSPGTGASVRFDGAHDRIDISRATLVDPGEWTIVALVRTSVPAEASSIHPIYYQSNSNGAGASTIQAFIDTDGTLRRVGVIDGLGAAGYHPTPIDDGLPHLVFVQRSLIGTYFGIAIDSTTLENTAFVGGLQGGSGTSIGGAASAPAGYSDNHFEGDLAHVAIFDSSLDDTDRQSIYDGWVSLAGEGSHSHIDYLLDRAGFPTADRALTTGYSTLGAADIEGQFTLDLIRRIEKTEQGRFFISQAGDATFHARYHGQLVATISEVTFSDDGTETPYRSVEVVRPRRFIFNKVTVTTDGLSPLTVQDAVSIDAHGERELSVDAPLLPSVTAQQSLAEFVLTNAKDPQPHVFGLSVPLHKDFATLAPAVLALEQGSRVTFERTPLNTGSAISWEQTLEGYTERFDSTSWMWTPHLSPAVPVTFGVWDGSTDADEWGAALWAY
jgi:hypothetical protein